MKAIVEKGSVVVCVGTGGVGKTTVSAGLGLCAAQSGLKVLVLTIDPAKRLAQALGLDAKPVGETRVNLPGVKGELWAGLVDAEAAFESFVRENATDPDKASKLLQNTLYKQLSTNLSGSQEFTSLDILYRAVMGKKFDVVILDTPPAQNAKDFFSAPERIYALFQKSITKWFMKDSKEKSWLTRVVNKGTQTVLLALEKVTGSEFIGALAEFFNSIQGIQEQISERSIEVQALLKSEKTKFLLVTSFDEVKVKEVTFLFDDLSRMGYHLEGLVVNKCYPHWIKESLEAKGAEQGTDELDQFRNQMLAYFKYQQEKFKFFENKLQKQVTVVKLPEVNSELGGLAQVQEIAVRIDGAMGAKG